MSHRNRDIFAHGVWTIVCSFLHTGGVQECANLYRLDDGSRSLRDLFHRGNRCIDVPSAKREGVYFGFQGEINPVETDELSSKVFIPHTTLLFKLLKATSH